MNFISSYFILFYFFYKEDWKVPICFYNLGEIAVYSNWFMFAFSYLLPYVNSIATLIYNLKLFSQLRAAACVQTTDNLYQRMGCVWQSNYAIIGK